MGIYSTLLASECKYNSKDKSHPQKQGQRKKTILLAAHYDLFTQQHKLKSKIGLTLFSVCLQIQGVRIGS